MKKWDHLRDIEVASVGQAEVGILIGMDCPELHWSLEEVRGGRGEPYAKKTIFGWTIVGSTEKKPMTLWGPVDDLKREAVVNTIITGRLLHQQLQAQWNADFRDLHMVDQEAMSVEDRKALKVMEDTVTKVNGKY